MAGPGVRLFISCVSGEFGAYRDTLRHALTRPNVEVKIQEDFKPLGGDTLRMLEDYIEQCEAIVHFVGDMAGSAPPATSVDDLLLRRPALQAKLEGKGLARGAGAAHLHAVGGVARHRLRQKSFDRRACVGSPARTELRRNAGRTF